MACRLDGAKPLSESMLQYYSLDPVEQTPMKSKSKFITSSFKKMHLKMLSVKKAAILS